MVLTVQSYSQRFEFVAWCFRLKSKGGFKFPSLPDLSYYFVYRQVIYMIHTFTNHKFVLRFSRQMFLQVEYLFAVVLFSAAKTTEGAENGVFFQIKENTFFSYRDKSLFWSGKTDSLLSCSVLCARQASCRSANFLENPGLCYLLGGEMQISSAAERLLQRDGSFYLTKVFDIDEMPCFSVTPSDNVHLITNKFKGFPALADKTRIVPLK